MRAWVIKNSGRYVHKSLEGYCSSLLEAAMFPSEEAARKEIQSYWSNMLSGGEDVLPPREKVVPIEINEVVG